jgi:hypothetical protein
MDHLHPDGCEQQKVHNARQNLRRNHRHHTPRQPAIGRGAQLRIIDQPETNGDGQERMDSAQFDGEMGIQVQILRQPHGQRMRRIQCVGQRRQCPCNSQ